MRRHDLAVLLVCQERLSVDDTSGKHFPAIVLSEFVIHVIDPNTTPIVVEDADYQVRP
jgi:hypothetical protein